MTQTCRIVLTSNLMCVECDEQPYIAPVPEQVFVDPNLGWNASAYSYPRHAGDCYTQFMLPDCVGTVVGLAPERASNDPRDIPHGFYIYEAGGRRLWSVAERGVEKTAPVARIAGSDVFRIERRGAVVSYFHNGKRVHVSEAPATGELVVVTCMFAANDGVH